MRVHYRIFICTGSIDFTSCPLETTEPSFNLVSLKANGMKVGFNVFRNRFFSEKLSVATALVCLKINLPFVRGGFKT